MIGYFNIDNIKPRKKISYTPNYLKDGYIKGRIVLYIIGKCVFYNYSPINSNHPDLEDGLKNFLKMNKIENEGNYYRYYCNYDIVSNSRNFDNVVIEKYCRRINKSPNILFGNIILK